MINPPDFCGDPLTKGTPESQNPPPPHSGGPSEIEVPQDLT